MYPQGTLTIMKNYKALIIKSMLFNLKICTNMFQAHGLHQDAETNAG